MSYYFFWLGEYAEWEHMSRNIRPWEELAIAYGYKEPQAGTDALNLTDSNSSRGVREPLAVEADGFITVHPKLNRPLNR